MNKKKIGLLDFILPAINATVFSILYRDGARSENLSGHIVMQRTDASRRRLLFCQNLGVRTPTLPTCFPHPCFRANLRTYSKALVACLLLCTICCGSLCSPGNIQQWQATHCSCIMVLYYPPNVENQVLGRLSQISITTEHLK